MTVLELIDEARQEGQDITVDFYPYEGGSTALTTMLPPEFTAGDMERALESLGTDEGIRRFANRPAANMRTGITIASH